MGGRGVGETGGGAGCWGAGAGSLPGSHGRANWMQEDECVETVTEDGEFRLKDGAIAIYRNRGSGGDGEAGG
jgi:hypothetical protein